MGEMLIKLGDDKLIRQISDLARAHKRSPEIEAETLLRKAVSAVRSNKERAKIASEIAAMTPTGHTRTDSTDMVREDRNR